MATCCLAFVGLGVMPSVGMMVILADIRESTFTAPFLWAWWFAGCGPAAVRWMPFALVAATSVTWVCVTLSWLDGTDTGPEDPDEASVYRPEGRRLPSRVVSRPDGTDVTRRVST